METEMETETETGPDKSKSKNGNKDMLQIDPNQMIWAYDSVATDAY